MKYYVMGCCELFNFCYSGHYLGSLQKVVISQAGTYLEVVAASKQAYIVDHGDSGSEELNGAGHEVGTVLMPGKGLADGRVVGAVVLVRSVLIHVRFLVVQVLVVGRTSQGYLHSLCQLINICHLCTGHSLCQVVKTALCLPGFCSEHRLGNAGAPWV